jgi:hypothetical protein
VLPVVAVSLRISGGVVTVHLNPVAARRSLEVIRLLLCDGGAP